VITTGRWKQKCRANWSYKQKFTSATGELRASEEADAANRAKANSG